MDHLTTYITILSYAVIAVIVYKIGLKIVSKAEFIKAADRTEIAFSVSIIWPMTVCFVIVYFLYLGISKLIEKYENRTANDPVQTKGQEESAAGD
jgi:hypothetical protein